MMDHLAEVLSRLGFPAASTRCEPLGRGHIHDTYRVSGAGRVVVLQRLNAAAFPHPDRLAGNTAKVVAALLAARDRGAYPLEVPEPVAPLVRVGADVWRASRYVEGTYTVDRADDAGRARAGAGAFGTFCAALAGIEAASLDETIPGFHDFDQRLAQLADAVADDAAGRARDVCAEIDRCVSEHDLARELRRYRDELPRRVCHNDTKINNLLFDERDHRPRAVVDLDTCMPGWWMHDFGDIVRTFCPAADEDARRLDGAAVRTDIFAAVCAGFVEPLAGLLSPLERESLWYGARAMPLMLALRFLADHLAGDRYFRVARAGHNLDRARNQLALYDDLTARENELRPQLSA